MKKAVSDFWAEFDFVERMREAELERMKEVRMKEAHLREREYLDWDVPLSSAAGTQYAIAGSRRGTSKEIVVR